MSEFALTTKAALNLDTQIDEAWEGFSLRELVDNHFYWLAAGDKAAAKLSKALENFAGTSLPEPGRLAVGHVGEAEVIIAWMAPDQWCLRGSEIGDIEPIEKVCFVTDQSHGWVGVSVQGNNTRDILARLCGLDLSQQVFKTGSVARTPVEGMHCHIACREAETGYFELFFQRSSARSFVDHIRHAAYSVCGSRTDSPI